MVLRPGRSQRRPWTVKDFVSSIAEHAVGFGLDGLGVVLKDRPAAIIRRVGQDLAVHHRISTTFIGYAP
jgi:hypothetical protein